MTLLHYLAGWVPYLGPAALALGIGLAWVCHQRSNGDEDR